MERIDVYRGIESTDIDGNPIQGEPGLWRSFDAMVSPAMAEEQVSETSTMGVQVGYEIHIRGPEPTGIRATDMIGVRGERLPLTMRPAEWRNKRGEHVGDVIAVRFTKGA